MPRRTHALAFTLLAGSLAAGLGDRRCASADDLATPPPDAIFVKTELVPATGDVPEGLFRTAALPVTFDFVESEGFPTGQMSVGDRRLGMALLRGRGPDAALLADLNGDGKLSRADESFPIAVSPWMVKDQAIGLTWKATVPWGQGSFALTIQDRIGALTGQWTPSAPGADGKPVAPVALSFDPDVPAILTKPVSTAARVRYATMNVATTGDAAVVVAALRGAKDEMSFLVGDGAEGCLPDVSTRMLATAQPLRRGATRTGTSWTTGPIEIGGVAGVLTALETLPTIQAKADPVGSRSGTAKLAGDPWTVLLLDGDFDGSFTGASDWWGFLPTSSVDNPNPNKLFEGNAPCWRDAAKAWRLLGVRADGTAVLAPFARAPSVETYLAERSERVVVGRWFPKFEPGRDEFVRSQGLDPARPLAATPVHWRHALTLADARAIAKAEGKPLLVDFEADWCTWCKRLDWIIYPDREVADRLAKFTAVKINVELDPTASFQSIEGLEGKAWDGMPAVGVFDAEGRPVTFKPTWAKAKTDLVDHIDGFQKPEDFAAALDAAYAAVSGSRTAGGDGGAAVPSAAGGPK